MMCNTTLAMVLSFALVFTSQAAALVTLDPAKVRGLWQPQLYPNP
jgi:hypothetical protein